MYLHGCQHSFHVHGICTWAQHMMDTVISLQTALVSTAVY